MNKPGKSKSKSSKAWLKEHDDDVYVRQSRQAGYRSRAAFKLLELDQKDKLFRSGMTVVDLGAAPGGWSQVVVKLIQPGGMILASDILPMDPIDGVEVCAG